MDSNPSAMSVGEWHIPRPSLTGSSGGGSASGDARSPRGSASSQGSSSNHSTHSVSSGSLLLSAAHLARVHSGRGEDTSSKCSNYSANLAYEGEARAHRKLQRTDAVVAIPEEAVDPFWSGVKRGSVPAEDAASVASSTHFTVVNGFTKTRPPKEAHWCCNSSHQITVLVISMTILFSACILAAICFVEMRMRRESAYRYS